MTRSRASAKTAGTRFERAVAEHAAAYFDDDRIERRARSGSKDRGDIAGVRTAFGERVVVEVKDTARLELGVWMNEVDVEKGNDDAPIGVIVHKRRGKGPANVGQNYVTMTYDDFLRIIGGPEKN